MSNSKQIIIGLCLLISQLGFGQIINPSFDYRIVRYCDITKIEKDSNNSTIYFRYTAPYEYVNGGWVNVNRTFFIRDCNTKLIYKLISANNIPIGPKKHNFQYSGQTLEFNLVFEPLPTSTKKIDIIENEQNRGFNFYGVNLTNSSNVTINKTPPTSSTNEKAWQNYFKDNIEKLYNIEGIYTCNYSIKVINYYMYEKVVFANNYGPAKIAIYKEGDLFTMQLLETYHDGKSLDGFELSKFVTYSFTPTSSENKFTGIVCYDGRYIVNFYCEFNDGRIDFNYQVPQKFTIEKNSNNNTHLEKITQTWIKSYPTFSTQNENKNKRTNETTLSSTGTGFAISANGYIVTNYHVIDNAKSIKVRGVNNDFSISYTAKVVASDKNNDLAIIQINDSRLTTISNIPYSIRNNSVDVGESVFVLGYPLTASMGDEIKLTTGIISAKSGFQGDITTYQMTAPIQPGNSGAPVFDSNGLLIAVTNAKHTQAENAGYAIKTNYLKNLIESLPTNIKFQTTNLLQSKALTEQVKVLKKFVYIIEIN